VTGSTSTRMSLVRVVSIWAALALALALPIAASAMSPLLAWRGPVYIVAGLAGVVALGLLLIQPVLIGGYLPGLSPYRSRYVHRCIGGLLVAATAKVMIDLRVWVRKSPSR
jgi:hypothetical protein